MVGDRKVLLFVKYRVQMLYKMVSKSTLGLTNVEEATSGAADTVDQVNGCAGEPLSDVEGVEHSIFGADATVVEDLGVGDRILAGGWVTG
eukprot:g27886.t1